MLGIFGKILGRRQSSKRKSTSTASARLLKSLKGRGLSFEPLEARQLLSVSPVILDNSDSLHYQEAGSNWASWSDTNAYGQNFRYHAQGDGTNTASWTFDTLEAGKYYQLFANYTAEANRPSNAPFTVLDGTTSLATVRINEHFAPIDSSFADHGWQSLGTYHTDTGSLTIRLSDDANGYVIADAVAAIEIPAVTIAPTVVDNADPAYAEQGSDWQGWSDATAYSGAIRYHAPGTGQNKATWTFEALDPTKSYRVLATWSAYNTHASNAPYTVSDDTTALATVRLNQRFAPNHITLDGQGWQNVGTYNPTSGKLVVSLSDDADGYAIADAIRLVEVQPLTDALSVIDNSDSAYGETGNNWLSWSETGAYQGDFRYHAPGTGQNTATWSFEALDPTKRYQVYTTWSPQPNRSTNSPFTILDDTNPLATVRVNQQFAPVHASFDGQSWESLGTYQFVSGTLTVSLSDDVSSGYVIADAVRIVEVPEVTAAPLAVDNADAAYSEIGEDWHSWSETGAYQGDFRYHAAGTGQNATTWTFDKLDPTKIYKVYATWSAQSNRTTDAPYTILDDQTSMDTVRVNQQLAPASATFDNQLWQILGTYVFFSGKLTVNLSDDATSGYVIADAIYVEEMPGIADNADAVYSETGSGWGDWSGENDYLGNSRRHAAASGESKALWQFTDLPAGYYNIYATWTAAADQATNAPFTVFDGTNLAGTERVNQQLAPASETVDDVNWQLVGSYWIESGQMRIELSDDADGVVIADAIRIVDPPVPLYWDMNGSAAGFGDGTEISNPVWDTTTPMWNTRADGTGTLTTWPSSRGTAYFAGGGCTITVSSSVEFYSISFRTSGYTVQGGALTLSSMGTNSIGMYTGVTAAISSPISGSYGLTIGGGTLTLSGNNSYSGGTTLSSGQLNINRVTALGTGALTISGTSTIGNTSTGPITLTNNNAQNWNANFTFAGPQSLNMGTGMVRMNANRQVTVSDGQLTVGGNIYDLIAGGNYSLTKLGSSMLTLSGANSYGGGTTVSGGTLQVGNDGISGSLTGNVNLASTTSVLAFNRSNNPTFSGIISGVGNVVKDGVGTWTLTGNNTYSGGTTINEGVLLISGQGTLGSQTSIVTNYAELDFDLSGSREILNPITSYGTVANLNDTLGSLLTLTDLTSSGCAIVINSMDGNLIVTGDLSGAGGGIVNSGDGTLTFDGDLSGDHTVIVDRGKLILLGNNTFTGDTYIYDGMMQIGDGVHANMSTLSGSIMNFGVLDFNLSGSSSVLCGGIIWGEGSVKKDGAGTLTLTDASTYSGDTTINGGELCVTGSISSSVITLNYGKISGDGSTGPLIVNNGIVSPGVGDINKINTSNFSLASDAHFSVDLTVTGFDQIDAKGTVNIDNAILDINSNRPGIDDDVVVLIKNDDTDPIIGNFFNYNEGDEVNVGSVTYVITYTYNAEAGNLGGGNDVALILCAQPTDFTATIIDGGHAQLTWIDHSSMETGYSIQQLIDGDWLEIQTTDSGSGTMNVTNTDYYESTAQYTFRVRAFVEV